ncbi:hypothetical protein [Planobispora longispora]|uniref:Uncharacterized protein n=1 Tax=Planobispora longispora TaxID=28887 RepID=A0A8J3RR43_9ACTN|nr:hypothetical protein [Planobispora longispora]BFE88349.1 hypothetical protein GCM10020093_109500 [Planobispora longispora]GIH79664.1 hypothetical protein Plo01_60930 [Planobispora longispora]
MGRGRTGRRAAVQGGQALALESNDLHEEIRALLGESGNVSGFFAEPARAALDADRWSREQLKAELAAVRSADPEGYDQRRADLVARMHAAWEAAARNHVA